ncbi:MAG TPA: type III-A CRISPR-associated RAMP protein Csm3 [Oscillatoriales bacterium UBA8482]|nr:MAG: type III-A CRISPR-associated RAMP protein Csm3 [Oscillatoriales cyanobacterium CG2_30_40_61]HBW57497.1 type III-A CRISPR-associated RAMP protein Csm3 [Oscillatoriales bacterium UBA8482]
MIVSTTEKPQKQLLGKLRIQGLLIVETGLHIGGGGETLSIGGLDKPVIRDPITQYPYLPGSSIKGKLRAILERVLNRPVNRRSQNTYRYESDDLVTGFTEIDGQYIKFDGARTCSLSRLFGSTGVNCWVEANLAQREGIFDSNSPTKTIKHQNQTFECTKVKGRNAPARLIVRDCHLTSESAETLKNIDTGLYLTEWKFENGLDRVTAAANPRQVERVPRGSQFKFELVYTVEDKDQVEEDLKNIAIALALLEDDALGGHGSRGYGKVRFQDFQFYYRSLAQYKQVSTNQSLKIPFETKQNTEDLIENFGQLNVKIQGELNKVLSSGENNKL